MEKKTTVTIRRVFSGLLALTLFAFAAFHGAKIQNAHSSTIPHAASRREQAAVSAALGPIMGVVTRVVDGDTVDVKTSANEVVRVRLLGVNTPETVDPRKPVECFGKEASAYTKRGLEGKTVTLETDPTQGTYDKYGRLLAYVFLSDGTNFDKQLVANGYAYEYTYRFPYRFQKEFKAAEREAREAQRGLWNNLTCASAPAG